MGQLIRAEFSGLTDLERMPAPARAFPGEHLHVSDLPYRFSSWTLDEPANVALWNDTAGELLAWVELVYRKDYRTV